MAQMGSIIENRYAALDAKNDPLSWEAFRSRLSLAQASRQA